MRTICVFCGSYPGRGSVYREAARLLGRTLAEAGIGLVFGGGSVGLMGEIAGAVLSHGGTAIGVMPRFLVEQGVCLEDVTERIVVETMHERKLRMHGLADGFVALPGGFGTVEEIFEAIAWGQLRLHAKPCALFDVGGFFGDVRRFLARAVREGFVDRASADAIIFEADARRLIDRMTSYRPPAFDKAASALRKMNRSPD